MLILENDYSNLSCKKQRCVAWYSSHKNRECQFISGIQCYLINFAIRWFYEYVVLVWSVLVINLGY